MMNHAFAASLSAGRFPSIQNLNIIEFRKHVMLNFDLEFDSCLNSTSY
jgi:hypothetical protein